MVTLSEGQLTSVARVNRQFDVKSMTFDNHPVMDGCVIVDAAFRNGGKRFVLDRNGGLVKDESRNEILDESR
jgi:3-hydroxymyristoyl/3-hydroxydecanoyl-(acyl carrier protein) dehydratase